MQEVSPSQAAEAAISLKDLDCFLWGIRTVKDQGLKITVVRRDELLEVFKNWLNWLRARSESLQKWWIALTTEIPFAAE